MQCLSQTSCVFKYSEKNICLLPTHLRHLKRNQGFYKSCNPNDKMQTGTLKEKSASCNLPSHPSGTAIFKQHFNYWFQKTCWEQHAKSFSVCVEKGLKEKPSTEVNIWHDTDMFGEWKPASLCTGDSLHKTIIH